MHAQTHAHTHYVMQARKLTRAQPCPSPFVARTQPAVAHANLGELAMDVLIGSLLPGGCLALAARLDEANCLPVVGNDAYSLEQPGTMATALELYHMQGESMYVWGEGGQGDSISHELPPERGHYGSCAPAKTQAHDPAAIPAPAGTTTYFLQQRAPAAKGRQAAFASNMADWLEGQGVQQVGRSLPLLW